MRIIGDNVKRFWSKVDKNGPVHPIHGQCWMWIGAKAGGYGHFRLHGTNVRSHRYSYRLSHGPISDNICVLHHCDNPSCVKPSHLFLGTKADNHSDMVMKSRRVNHCGEKNGRHILTVEQVKEIRARYKRWSYHHSNSVKLAREFKVTKRVIMLIVNNQAWVNI